MASKKMIYRDRLEGATELAVTLIENWFPTASWDMNPDDSIDIAGEHFKATIQNEFDFDEETGDDILSGLTYLHHVKKNGRWVLNNRQQIWTSDPDVMYDSVSRIIQGVLV